MRAKFIQENLDFERGLDSKTALDIGKYRRIKKGDRFQTRYKDELLDVKALDDEYPVGAHPDQRYIDFLDDDGGIGWAIRNIKTGKCYIPPGFKNESLDFERELDSKKALNIGKDRKIKAGDRFPIWIYYTDEFKEVTAISDEMDINVRPEDGVFVDIKFDNGEIFYAVKGDEHDENNRWELGES